MPDPIITGAGGARLPGRTNATITRPCPARYQPAGLTLDAFDRDILRIVRRDSKTPQRTSAAAMNLYPAAVQRRIAAMADAGAIVRNVAIVDAQPWGWQ